MKIINITKNATLSSNCKMADTFIKRFLGLMGKKNFPHGEGLYFRNCPQIHMFFMKIPIDVLFIDKNSKVVHMLTDFKPWQVSPMVKNAKDVIELPSGTISSSNTEEGDVLSIDE